MDSVYLAGIAGLYLTRGEDRTVAEEEADEPDEGWARWIAQRTARLRCPVALRTRTDTGRLERHATVCGMTAIRGLREAGFLLAIGAALSVVAATIWVLIGSGEFVNRFAMCLVITGMVLSITGGGALHQAATADAFAWLGKGPERGDGDHGGGQALTSIGIFLFVAVPLVLVGLLLLA
jgi:ribose/xylose/arabinose/galactoside ABC-type transport system permease subunit